MKRRASGLRALACTTAAVLLTMLLALAPAGAATASEVAMAANSANPASTREDTTRTVANETHSITDPASPWVLVNKRRPLDPIDHTPTDLVTPDVPTTGANTQLRAEAASALASLAAAANETLGAEIVLASGYRAFDIQAKVYAGWVAADGQEIADTYSARPGFSEHQTGLAADLAEAGHSFDEFGNSATGAWVAANAWRFGFIVRFQPGQESVTGYVPEPWHLRYVGQVLAHHMHNQGIKSLETALRTSPAPDYPAPAVAGPQTPAPEQTPIPRRTPKPAPAVRVAPIIPM